MSLLLIYSGKIAQATFDRIGHIIASTHNTISRLRYDDWALIELIKNSVYGYNQPQHIINRAITYFPTGKRQHLLLSMHWKKKKTKTFSLLLALNWKKKHIASITIPTPIPILTYSVISVIDGFPENIVIDKPTIAVEHISTRNKEIEFGNAGEETRIFHISLYARTKGELDEISAHIFNLNNLNTETFDNRTLDLVRMEEKKNVYSVLQTRNGSIYRSSTIKLMTRSVYTKN